MTRSPTAKGGAGLPGSDWGGLGGVAGPAVLDVVVVVVVVAGAGAVSAVVVAVADRDVLERAPPQPARSAAPATPQAARPRTRPGSRAPCGARK